MVNRRSNKNMSNKESLDDMDKVYEKAMDEVEKLGGKNEQQSYFIIRTLLSRLTVDLQTWRSILNDWMLMQNFTMDEYEPLLDMFKQITLHEIDGMRVIMQSKPVRNAYTLAMDMVKKMSPQPRPIPRSMVYVDRSNNNTEDKVGGE